MVKVVSGGGCGGMVMVELPDEKLINSDLQWYSGIVGAVMVAVVV